MNGNNIVCIKTYKVKVVEIFLLFINGFYSWLFLPRGVAIKLRDRMGRTPFNVAESSGNEACAQFLEQVCMSLFNLDGLDRFGRQVLGTG